MTTKTTWLSGTRRRGARLAGASLLLALLGGCAEGPQPEATPQSPETPAQQAQGVGAAPALIRGYIAARIGDGDRLPRRDIAVPGVKVYARNLSTGAISTHDVTDLSGRFTVPADKGRFEICWDAPGFITGCASNSPVSVSDPVKNAGMVLITPDNPLGTAIVWGRVSMADGSKPRKFSPSDNVNAFARVQLLDKAGGIRNEVFVNNFGEYILTQVPETQPSTLRASIEAAEGRLGIHPDANLAGIPWHQMDLRIGNTPPRVKPITATDANGRWAKANAAGATVNLKVAATDREGQPLQYLWSLDPGHGSLDTASGPQVKWTLPSVRGYWTARVLVWDGHGGYSEQSLSLRTDGAFVTFSGTVTDQTGVALSAVRVEIITPAGTTTSTTNTAGFFRVFARDADRYVFNLRKTGYGMVSQNYDRGITGGRWKMQKATVQTVNPTLAIDITNTRTSSECPGRPSEQLEWTGKYASVLTPQWQDGRGNVVAPPREQQGSLPLPNPQKPRPSCGPGMRVQIPANALVDSLGRAPTGNVDIAVTTIDLKSAQMPGDFTTQALNGQTLVAQSYGAGTVEITAGNTKYNLRPGVTATVTIPVDPTQLATGAALPPTIPVLYYDEVAGIWKEELTATLNAARTAYVVQAPHFSIINMDLVKTNQACVRIDSSALSDGQYNLEIAIPMPAGAAPVYRTVLIDNSVDKLHALYNLPTNTDIVLVPIRQASTVPIGTFVVNTGGAQNPTTPNAPSHPYEECATEVVFEDRVLPDPTVDFLHGLTSFAGINLDELDPANPAESLLKDQLIQASADYYAQVDPRGKRLTFANFKATNNFPAGEVRAVYANRVDLGFGRDMHCNKGTDFFGATTVACYVSNYGTIDSDNAVDVEEARLAGTPIATVAMEYSVIESPDGFPDEFDDPERVVKFYVYDGAGVRQGAANLDQLGTRPIPQLCMVCHNGEYFYGDVPAGAPVFPDRDSVKLKAKFLPFDTAAYDFSTTAGFTKADMQDELKNLNVNYVLATNPGTAITELVNGWYAGGSPTLNESYVVPGWNVAAEPIKGHTYQNLVAKSCRTCHVSQLDTALVFNTATQAINRLGQIETRVCVQHTMPHAKKTHELFWNSTNPHQPGVLQNFGAAYGNAGNGWVGTQCGTYVSGGSTPVTFYSGTIQPIWDTRCVACHVGGSPPAGLTLATGVSHADLVNVVSTQSSSGMDLIEPGNPNASYLWHKLNNTHTSVPASGFGSQMPLGGPNPLPALELSNISTWINGGANP